MLFSSRFDLLFTYPWLFISPLLLSYFSRHPPFPICASSPPISSSAWPRCMMAIVCSIAFVDVAVRAWPSFTLCLSPLALFGSPLIYFAFMLIGVIDTPDSISGSKRLSRPMPLRTRHSCLSSHQSRLSTLHSDSFFVVRKPCITRTLASLQLRLVVYYHTAS